MNNRVALLVYLDTAMLLLVCVLESIKLTGLEWHQCLGFALPPLVLLHVLTQWQSLVSQFRSMGKLRRLSLSFAIFSYRYWNQLTSLRLEVSVSQIGGVFGLY